MGKEQDLRSLAFEDYQKGFKYREIADKHGVSLSTVKSWASRHWKKAGCNPAKKKLQPENKKVATRGGQPGNKNATGPPGNKNAEKHGLFSKYLPEETLSIIQQMPMDPLDVLWDQIQIAYAAIMRAQQIMYVKGRDDKTFTKVGEGHGNIESCKWEVQQAWDKQATFMQAQARAQAELRSLIKQYDETLHKNWDLATEEQRARITQLRAQTDNISSAEKDRPIQITFAKASEQHGRN